ncbi:MAG: glycosyltransferase family 4 protein [Candidatus Peribacteraceae bacterium]|nr:glycosyltransferase family 4 protein [Candidatus Peribacteraceae bacterium]
MRLLIVTQKVDRSDCILGFFHRWLEEFAVCCERVTVIGQQVGDYALARNITVHSLEKEKGRSRLGQIVRFWSLLWRERGAYDAVLVHMTPVWVLLGWPLWGVFGKRMYLWYEIRRGSRRLTTALWLVRKVFSATKEGLPYPSAKQVVLGHGIDTDTFKPGSAQRENDAIIAVGRITRSKRYDVILHAFTQLPKTCHLRIAGMVVTAQDEREWRDIESLKQKLGLSNRVKILFAHYLKMPDLLRGAGLMLHACVGGLDKTVLEAMACGCPVVSSSAAVTSVLPPECRATDETLGEAALAILALDEHARRVLSEDLRRRVLEGHDVKRLIAAMVREMEG